MFSGSYGGMKQLRKIRTATAQWPASAVDAQLLERFREGEAELPADAIERLIATLGLRLMHEIPRTAGA